MHNIFFPQNKLELLDELKKGVVIDKDEFPADAVRINSKVKIEDHTTAGYLN